MMRPLRALPWILAAAMALAAGAALLWAGHERGAARAAGLRADSLEAAEDTLRVVLADRDGRIWWWQQRAVQAELERDHLAGRFEQERIATARLTLQLDTLRARSTAPVVVRDTLRDVRQASFAQRLRRGGTEFGSLRADVTMPPPPAAATLDAEVVLDSLVLRPGYACGPPGPGGIRPAFLTVRAPSWLQARADSVQLDPRVCNRPPGHGPFRLPLGLELPAWAAEVAECGLMASSAWLVANRTAAAVVAAACGLGKAVMP